MAGWAVVESPAGAHYASLNTLTLDNSNRGINAASATRYQSTAGWIEMVAWCATSAAVAPTWGQSVTFGSGWTNLGGNAVSATSTVDPFTYSVSDTVTTGSQSGWITNLCPVGAEVRAFRIGQYNGSTYVYTWLYRAGTATPTTCATSFTNARAAYIGTTLTVMFGWSGTVPAAGWRVHAPGDGFTSTGTANTFTVPRTKATGSAEYDAAGTVSGLVAGTTTVRISSGDSFGCYVVVTAGSVALVNGVPNIGTNPDTGEGCSTWDLFCQMSAAFKWAFVPDDASQNSLKSTLNTVTTKFPFAVVGTLQSWGDLIVGCSNSDAGTMGDGCQTVSLRFTMPSAWYNESEGIGNPTTRYFVIANENNPSQEPGFMQSLSSYRGVLNVAVWLAFIGGLAWAVYRWATPFGALAGWSGRSSGKSDD